MRIPYPAGFILLLSPCLWGLALAKASTQEWQTYLLFILGAILMRSAGCIINDLIDRNLDAHVIRTSGRPLVTKTISLPFAFIVLFTLLILSLSILIQFNIPTIVLGFLSVGLAIIYPFMKRLTYWPQAFLGITFNWGALMGWTAIHPYLSWQPILLYIAGIFWTLGYDTLYAAQDMEDDLKIGIRSSALKCGPQVLRWVAGFYGVMISILLLLGVIESFGTKYYLMIGLVVICFWYQLLKTNLKSPLTCLKAFKMNMWVGILIFIGILMA